MKINIQIGALLLLFNLVTSCNGQVKTEVQKETPKEVPVEIEPTKTEPTITTKPEPTKENNAIAIVTAPKPSSINSVIGHTCSSCRGKGKIYQAEIRKNKMVTKDISNGLGPRNFVTYSVNEIVRPAGNVLCGKCQGTGKSSND